MGSMTIGKKLGLSFSVIMALTLALSVEAWRASGTLGRALDEAVDVTAQKMDLSQAMAKRVYEVAAALRSAHLAGLNDDVEFARASEARLAAATARITEQVGQIRALMGTEPGVEALLTVEQGMAVLLPLGRQYVDLGKRKEAVQAHVLLKQQITPVVDRMDQATAALVKRQREVLAKAAAEADSAIAFYRWLVLLSFGFALATGAAGVVVVRRSCSDMRMISSQMREAAEQVAVAASEVSSASQSLAQGANEQAASLEETSASSAEINAMAKRNAEVSTTAAAGAERSQARFAESAQALDQMLGAMDAIGSASGKISKIIKVIDGIAFQTNILALNAAVEAARAGESGLGFAVVAGEVRNLAGRCAEAARDTSALIEESLASSRDGKAKVDLVAATVRDISAGSLEIKTLVEEVSVGSQQQGHGVEQMAKALEQMEQVTQRTAASAEQTAAAGQEMSAQAVCLRDLVRRLTVMVDGRA
jgi:methyl-accepting chemotaxis protein